MSSSKGLTVGLSPFSVVGEAPSQGACFLAVETGPLYLKCFENCVISSGVGD